jgi:hypothetical protein
MECFFDCSCHEELIPVDKEFFENFLSMSRDRKKKRIMDIFFKDEEVVFILEFDNGCPICYPNRKYFNGRFKKREKIFS